MLISIVIPAYGQDALLERCLDSIAAQCKCNDVEIVCIDDGSDTNLQNICDLYSVSYTHQSHQGATAARNKGLSLAQGEWVWFVDADDMIAPNALERLCNLLPGLGNGVNLVKLGDMLHKQEPVPHPNDGQGIITTAIELQSHCRSLLDHTTYLFRRSFLQNNNIAYPKGHRILEDSLFVLEVLSKATEIYSNSTYRFYRLVGSGNATGQHSAKGHWVGRRSKLFMPDILEFFDALHKSPYHKVFDRYMYVYQRVLAVKCCPLSALRLFRSRVVSKYGYFGPADLKMRLMCNGFAYYPFWAACLLLRWPAKAYKMLNRWIRVKK